MRALWQFIVETADAQISVDDGKFWYIDLRALLAIVFVPFLLVAIAVGWRSTTFADSAPICRRCMPA